MSFFSLADHVYGCGWDDRVILLDSQADSYSILQADEKQCLESLLREGELTCSNWDPGLLSGMKAFLKKDDSQIRFPNPHHAYLNIFDWTKYQGRRTYRWSSSPVLEALGLYTKIYFRLRSREGLNTLLRDVKQFKQPMHARTLSEDSILSLIHAINRAVLIFPFSTRCLEWAFCFYFMGRRRGWPLSFLLGLTHLPFWSHAWVEINGMAISNEVHFPRDLKIILKEPCL